MCYDISYTILLESIMQYFGSLQTDVQIEMDFTATIHILAQAYKKHPVVTFEDDDYKLKPFEWGLIADYMNTPEKIKQGRQWMCNAQSEKIFGDKKSYWHRIRNKRCLIPVNGFFEHREIKGWKNKVPYYIHLKSREMFCLPGLYNHSPVPDPETGESVGTFTILTRAANPVMRQIHNGGTNAFRMPLLLPKELELKWLKPGLTDEEMQEIISYEMSSDDLICIPVAPIRTTKPRTDNKTRIDPFEWANLPPLGNDDGEIQTALF